MEGEEEKNPPSEDEEGGEEAKKASSEAVASPVGSPASPEKEQSLISKRETLSTTSSPKPSPKRKSPASEISEIVEESPKATEGPPPPPPSAVNLAAPTNFRGGSLAVFRSGVLQGTTAQGVAHDLFQKRSPFIHNPPQPEERRPRIASPRTPIEYIINLREDLADFQESHGLPRSRDYSFVSLGLALAQETGRAIYSLFQMFTELFPIVAIVSLILRFALDKLIEILETQETGPKVKKSVIFALEMIAIMIPLWILIGTIVIPLISLLFSIFKKVVRIKGGKKKTVAKPKMKAKTHACSSFRL